MGLSRKTPTTLAVTLALISVGETISLDINFRNKTKQQIEDYVKELQERTEAQAEDGAEWVSREALMFLVEDIKDCEYPLTHEGLIEMNDDRPGIIEQIAYGYHEARQAKAAGNSKRR